jgi:hypothetical protein
MDAIHDAASYVTTHAEEAVVVRQKRPTSMVPRMVGVTVSSPKMLRRGLLGVR